MSKPRYTIGTITTNDEDVYVRALRIYNENKLTHEEIYMRGIDSVVNDLKEQKID